MGKLRLLLALSVVLAHSPVGPQWWRPLLDADLAVEVFFVISGFYMALVLSTKYEPVTAAGRASFWRSRFLRIFPAYWIVAASVILFWLAFYHPGITQFFKMPLLISVWAAVSNVALFGLDGLMFIVKTDAGQSLRTSFAEGAGTQPHHLMLIAPAWTLSLELVFYLLAPWISRWRTSALWAIVAASLLVRVALALLGLDSDPWTYRFLPSEFGLFIAGMLAYRGYARGMLNTPAPTVALIVLCVVFPLLPDGPAFLGRSALGIATVVLAPFALPWLFARSRDDQRDRAIGDLSYPVYLVHLPVMMYLRQFWPSLDVAAFTLATVAITLLVAHLLEREAVPRMISVAARVLPKKSARPRRAPAPETGSRQPRPR